MGLWVQSLENIPPGAKREEKFFEEIKSNISYTLVTISGIINQL